MIANSDEIVLRQPPVASKMTILPSQILPDPDLQVSPFKKGILRKEANRPKSHSNVRFNLKSHPLADLSSSSSSSTGTPAEFSSSSGGSGTPAELCRNDSEVAATSESSLTSQEQSFNTNIPHPADSCPVTDVPLIALNSSQHILHKIHVLARNDEAHVIKELQRQLNIDKKKEINEKAASKVDYKPDSVLYQNLISLDVPIVCVKKKKKPVVKKKTQEAVPPMFYDSAKENTHEEKGNFTLQGIPLPRVKLLKSPPLSAFTLYQHNRAWEGLLIHNHS
ncbi:uncharacterized protein LOC106867378 [Octopus bimaculoides]|uniref:Protein phosphatase 1 regulatory subunit 35 C-terminal domain-containing protein n=1 Tax=Octopus bimaculoides TaxID=37653 RepID=A0A0L8I269_OCTBM|nr:uncharacterized protein LOC106867378 [Octopus bimaculoides]|eukprot:XP_014767721.1 PREDICTED: uncharacterized protein LOC106867378 [Octopus bimaculoides]